jgi:hypothetical protein
MAVSPTPPTKFGQLPQTEMPDERDGREPFTTGLPAKCVSLAGIGNERSSKAWSDNGWPAEPDAGEAGITVPFNAPSEGPPSWNVYRIHPQSAILTLSMESGGLTRFRFWRYRSAGSPHLP